MLTGETRTAREPQPYHQPSPTTEGTSMSYVQPQPQQVAPKNAGLALLASFFIPGLGSLMVGRMGWGIGIFCAYVAAWVSMFVLIGFVLVPAVWIWGMVDAYVGAQSWNRRHGIVS